MLQPRARWLTFGSLLLAAAIAFACPRSVTGLVVALAILVDDVVVGGSANGIGDPLPGAHTTSAAPGSLAMEHEFGELPDHGVPTWTIVEGRDADRTTR